MLTPEIWEYHKGKQDWISAERIPERENSIAADFMSRALNANTEWSLYLAIFPKIMEYYSF